MKKRLFIALSLLLTCSYAADKDDFSQIRANLQANLPSLIIDRISTTPFAGAYEVDSGRKVFYVDKTGNYLMVGNLVDLTNKTSLTESRTNELNQVNWQQLPNSIAIRRQIGDGSRQIAIFTDPDCPFCKRLEAETTNKLENVTIYYYLYPLAIHPNAEDHAKRILCAENPLNSLLDFMQKDKPLGKNNTCKNIAKLSQMQKVANDVVQVNATPTIVLPNGRISAGLIPADKLNILINENSVDKNKLKLAESIGITVKQ